MDSMQRFLSKLKELLKGKVRDADLTSAEFDECVRKAAGHAGGMARWEKMQTIDATEGNRMNKFKLMGEIALSEDRASGTVQIFPPVGRYSHPLYGEINISPAFLKTVKANFDAKAYQQDLPLTIDLEHQTKLSGAAGWIKDVDIKGDAGMWATIEFNDRGQSLVKDNAYMYFSPEFYDEWTDPATNKTVDNLLIGGALTNRPFFKAMAPVVMGSEGVFAFSELTFAAPVGDEPDDDVPAEDKAAIDQLSDTLAALTSFETDELMDLSPTALDGLIEAVDLFQGEVTAGEEKSMGGHAGHKGQHSTHGGSMGPIAKKAARKRVMGRLEGDRKGMLAELRSIRTMKLNSPTGKALRSEMLKAAQADLAKTRGKMVAARARYRTEPGQFAEPDMDEMIKMMQSMMDMMGDMKMPDEMMSEMDAMMGKMKKAMPKMQASEPTGPSGTAAGAASVDGKPANRNGGEPMGMTEEEARQFGEIQASLKTLSEKVTAAEAKAATEETARKAAEEVAKQANDRVIALETDAKRKTLSEHVRANRLGYQGEVDAVVDRLMSYSEKLPAEDFTAYLDEHAKMHSQMAQSALFKEIGSANGAPVAGSVSGEFEAQVVKTMTERKIDRPAATAAVASENPQLYRRYDQEQKLRQKRGE